MKHRVLSLVIALVLCLGICPMQVLAAELPEDAQQFVDTGEPPEEEIALLSLDGPALQAEASSIRTDYQGDGFIFAQGVPIVIREVDGVTNIYDVNGEKLAVIALGVDWGTLDNRVFAGGSFEDVTSTAEIIIRNYTAKCVLLEKRGIAD